jgi:threonine 3-dehydrogenase
VEIGTSFPDALFSYDACDIVWRRLTLTGVHNYDAKHLQMGVDMLSQTHNLYPFKDIVTHRFSLDDINKGLRLAESGQAIRVAIQPWA